MNSSEIFVCLYVGNLLVLGPSYFLMLAPCKHMVMFSVVLVRCMTEYTNTESNQLRKLTRTQ